MSEITILEADLEIVLFVVLVEFSFLAMEILLLSVIVTILKYFVDRFLLLVTLKYFLGELLYRKSRQEILLGHLLISIRPPK